MLLLERKYDLLSSSTKELMKRIIIIQFFLIENNKKLTFLFPLHKS